MLSPLKLEHIKHAQVSTLGVIGDPIQTLCKDVRKFMKWCHMWSVDDSRDNLVSNVLVVNLNMLCTLVKSEIDGD